MVLFKKIVFWNNVYADTLNLYRSTKKIHLKKNIIKLFNFDRGSQVKNTKIFTV